MLHGPPGTGKTSFLQALAITHGMRLYMLQVSSQSMTKERLATLLAETEGDRCMVALEDAEKGTLLALMVSELPRLSDVSTPTTQPTF